MPTIIKDTLHPENESGTDLYPKTSSDQVVGYGQNLDGKNYALEDETCKKPINLGTPTHVLGVEGGSSNQPISIFIGLDRNNMPKRNTNGNIESLYDATKDNEYVRKRQFDKGLSEVSAPVVVITATPTATQGTINSTDLTTLQKNKSAIVRFNNELYYFMDDEYKSGYLTYSHVGVDSGIQWVKSITITISSLGWVLTKERVGGTPMYEHDIVFTVDGTDYDLYIFNNSPNKILNNKLSQDLYECFSNRRTVPIISVYGVSSSIIYYPTYESSYDFDVGAPVITKIIFNTSLSFDIANAVAFEVVKKV